MSDDDGATEWVLPLVVRIERDAPPRRTDALEAAAKAVLTMLTTSEPEWLDAVRAWDGSRIRKVVRRARGADWQRASRLPGVTIRRRSARVRVFPPIPVDSWPPELAKLQVGGTELEDPEQLRLREPEVGVPTIYLPRDVPMSAGKAMAQVGHAAQLGWRRMPPSVRFGWQLVGFPLSVRIAGPMAWRNALITGVVVHDAGFTEVDPGTATAAFIGPFGV